MDQQQFRPTPTEIVEEMDHEFERGDRRDKLDDTILLVSAGIFVLLLGLAFGTVWCSVRG